MCIIGAWGRRTGSARRGCCPVTGIGECGVPLAGSPARPFPRYDRAAQEQFPAPDAPRLTAVKRALQAGNADPAALAQGLRRLDVRRRLGEEQFRALHARQVTPCRNVGDAAECRDPTLRDVLVDARTDYGDHLERGMAQASRLQTFGVPRYRVRLITSAA